MTRPTQLLTVKEYAAMSRVDESTVRRWIRKGAVHVRRTPGGGIRIPTNHELTVFNVPSERRTE
jgi:excisionase family DNA binding protein